MRRAFSELPAISPMVAVICSVAEATLARLVVVCSIPAATDTTLAVICSAAAATAWALPEACCEPSDICSRIRGQLRRRRSQNADPAADVPQDTTQVCCHALHSFGEHADFVLACQIFRSHVQREVAPGDLLDVRHRFAERDRDAAGNRPAEGQHHQHGEPDKPNQPHHGVRNGGLPLQPEGVQALLTIFQIVGDRGVQEREPGYGLIPNLGSIDVLASLYCLDDPVVRLAPGGDHLLDIAQQGPALIRNGIGLQILQTCGVIRTQSENAVHFLGSLPAGGKPAHTRANFRDGRIYLNRHVQLVGVGHLVFGCRIDGRQRPKRQSGQAAELERR